MSKIILNPNFSYSANIEDFGNVVLYRPDSSKPWSILKNDKEIATGSDRPDIEDRFGDVNELQIIDYTPPSPATPSIELKAEGLPTEVATPEAPIS